MAILFKARGNRLIYYPRFSTLASASLLLVRLRGSVNNTKIGVASDIDFWHNNVTSSDYLDFRPLGVALL